MTSAPRSREPPATRTDANPSRVISRAINSSNCCPVIASALLKTRSCSACRSTAARRCAASLRFRLKRTKSHATNRPANRATATWMPVEPRASRTRRVPAMTSSTIEKTMYRARPRMITKPSIASLFFRRLRAMFRPYSRALTGGETAHAARSRPAKFGPKIVSDGASGGSPAGVGHRTSGGEHTPMDAVVSGGLQRVPRRVSRPPTTPQWTSLRGCRKEGVRGCCRAATMPS